jgi:quercetin dioxygenase-like cupin family protein
MQITPNSLATPRRPAEWFSGTVDIDAIAAASRRGAAAAYCTPGARTAWHTHPRGQRIWATEGIGRCQREAARSRSSGPATASSSSPVSTTDTALRRRAA